MNRSSRCGNVDNFVENLWESNAGKVLTIILEFCSLQVNTVAKDTTVKLAEGSKNYPRPGCNYLSNRK